MSLALTLSMSAPQRATAGSSTIAAPFATANGPSDGPVASWYNGWSGTYGSNHTVSAIEPFTVRRPGYDATGAKVTYDDTVYVTRMVRTPYPNSTPGQQPVANYPTTCAFSAPVCVGDTLFGGAVNNSTLGYTTPIAVWLTPPKQIIDASTGLDIEVYATHFYARNGQGVACVKITGTPTTGSPVTKTCTYQLSTKYAETVPAYVANFVSGDFPSNGNADVTFTFQAYPWVGATDDSNIATNAGVFPSVLTSNTAIVHRTVGPTVKYAFVDGVGGAPAVANDLTTAKLTPYATITAAMTGLFAASAEAGGFHVVCKAGVALTWDNTNPTGATRTAKISHLIVEGDPTDSDPYTNVTVTTSGTNKTIFTTPGAGNLNYICIRNLTLTIPAASNLANFGSTVSLWLDHVKYNSSVNPPFGGMGYGFATQCDSTGSTTGNPFGLSSTNQRYQLVRACNVFGTAQANVIVSCRGGFLPGDSTNLATENLLCLNNRAFNGSGSGNAVTMPTAAAGPPTQQRNIAIVSCTISNTNAASPGPSYPFNEHTTHYQRNMLYFNLTNSRAGASTNNDACRMNVLGDAPASSTVAAGTTFGTATDQGSWENIQIRNCLNTRMSYKYDTFSFSNDSVTGANNMIGGWGFGLFGCSHRNNQSEYTLDNNFRSDLATSENGYMGINSIAQTAITYTDRANNNFKPTAGFRTVPAFDQVDSWDQLGNARRLDGTGAAGALES